MDAKKTKNGENSFICLRSKENSDKKKRRTFLFTHETNPKIPLCLLKWELKCYKILSKTLRHLNYRDLKSEWQVDLTGSDEKCETCCLAKKNEFTVSKKVKTRTQKLVNEFVLMLLVP